MHVNRKEIIEELEISVKNEDFDKNYISKLNRNDDKVRYLRFVKGYKQVKVAELIGISERQVQRIEKKLKNI